VRGIAFTFIALSLASILFGSGSRGAAAETRIVAAGDIACQGHPCPAQRRTANLVGRLDPRLVLPLGDTQYERGELRDFRRSYGPTWGRFRHRTRPVPGNHEYLTRRARGFFRYFNPVLRGHRGFYSFDAGGWHVLALNSERRSKRQTRWLRGTLRRNDHVCELAYWHRPRWSSGSTHGGTQAVARWWRILYGAGADVVLNGHEHNYERFAKMTPRGRDRGDGIREFVVGTGGRSLYPFGRTARGSQRRVRAYGVLALDLRRAGYEWRFVAARGGTRDTGSESCHP
jgi:calcineurin-like phosphoesterase family protein